MNPRLTEHDGTTSDEVLYVLTDCTTVPLRHVHFAVITGTYTPHRLEPQTWPFTPGEILAICERTVAGQLATSGEIVTGRDPYTGWEDSSAAIYSAPDLDAALAVAELVRSQRPRGYYGWTADGLSYLMDQESAHRQWCGAPDDGIVRIGPFTGRGWAAEQAERRRGRQDENPDPS